MKKNRLLALCVAVTATIFQSDAQIVNTIAGTGIPGFSGDGGMSVAAKVNRPHGLDVDAAGNIYVADNLNSRIRKITPLGIITTVAGNGVAGYSGDGGPATAAAINQPFDVKVDAAGNLYISDLWNYRVRKVNTAGVISTVAGTGVAGFSGDGGAATLATFGAPCGLAFDAAGNLYVGDGDNHRVRKINMTTGIITTVAGNGVGTFGGDGGPATAANLWYPNFLYMDAADNLYISDNQNQRIRKVTPAGTITTFAGNGFSGFSGDGGPAISASLAYPGGMTMDASGNAYIADNINHRIRKVSSSGTITTFGGTGSAAYGGDGGPIATASFNTITDVAFDAYGNLTVADLYNHRVRGILVGPNLPPSFVENTGLTLSLCGGTTKMLDTILKVSDGNTMQTLAWSVVQSPYHGTLSGFTATAVSSGASTMPSSVSYTAAMAYTGPDSFKIRVFDGFAADTLTILVNISPAPVTPFISGIPTLCIGSSTTLTTTGTGGVWSSSAPGIATVSSSGVVTALTGGVVNITYAITASCGTVMDVFAMTVDAVPAVPSIAGTSTVCVGATTVFAASIPGGIWGSSDPSKAMIAGSGVVTGVAVGTAVISYQLINACGTEIALQTVSVNPLPFAGTITGVDSVCPGKKVTLTDATAGGTWMSSNTAIGTIGTSGVFAGVAMGSATVWYIVTNSCGSDTAMKTVVVRNPKICFLAIDGIAANSKVGMHVFPNPNNGNFYVTVNSVTEVSVHVVISNVVGTKVYEYDVPANKEQRIDVHLIPGIYIISASGQDLKYVHKMIVE